MSHTAESSVTKEQSDFLPLGGAGIKQSDSPSAIEMVSYGFCCVAQGVITILYLGLIVFVPIAIRHGIFSS